MTLSEPIPQMRDFVPTDVFDLPRADSQFYITSSVGEMQDPYVVFRSQQVHGISYVHSKYFTEAGKQADGRLHDDLDGTRSSGDGKVVANYLLATRNDRQISEGSATVRLLDIGPQGSIEDLPTYKYFADTFNEEVKGRLNYIVDTYGNTSIREIAALGTSDRGSHPGSFELIRAMMQNSMLKEAIYGQPEMYIASLTPKSLVPVLEYIDPKSANILGASTQIFSEDPRSLSIQVTPVLIDLSSVLKNISESIADAEDAEEQTLLEMKFKFLADGLPEDIVARYTSGSNAIAVNQ